MVLTIELNIGRVGVGVSGNISHRKVESVIIMYGFLVPKEIDTALVGK